MNTTWGQLSYERGHHTPQPGTDTLPPRMFPPRGAEQTWKTELTQNTEQGTNQRTLNNGRARTEDPASAADPRRPVPAEGVKHRAGAIAASLLVCLDPLLHATDVHRRKRLPNEDGMKDGGDDERRGRRGRRQGGDERVT